MIRIENIYKTFNKGTINANRSLNGLNLTVSKGEFVSVIGSNGAGKSTMFNALTGALSVDAGKIYIDTIDVTAMPEHKRSRLIGRVFQDPMVGTASALTIGENLALAMKRQSSRGLSFAAKKSYVPYFQEQLSQLDLGLEHRLNDVIGLLSGGQRQSITLLMAALVRPHIVLLDEHTAALDPKTADNVMAITERMIAKYNLTALMISHNMEHAIRFGNRLVMLHKGQIAIDVKGDERARLTVPALLDRFYSVTSNL